MAERQRQGGSGTQAETDQDRVATLGGDQTGHVGRKVVDAPWSGRRRRLTVAAQIRGDHPVTLRERFKRTQHHVPVATEVVKRDDKWTLAALLSVQGDCRGQGGHRYSYCEPV